MNFYKNKYLKYKQKFLKLTNINIYIHNLTFPAILPSILNVLTNLLKSKYRSHTLTYIDKNDSQPVTYRPPFLVVKFKEKISDVIKSKYKSIDLPITGTYDEYIFIFFLIEIIKHQFKKIYYFKGYKESELNNWILSIRDALLRRYFELVLDSKITSSIIQLAHYSHIIHNYIDVTHDLLKIELSRKEISALQKSFGDSQISELYIYLYIYVKYVKSTFKKPEYNHKVTKFLEYMGIIAWNEFGEIKPLKLPSDNINELSKDSGKYIWDTKEWDIILAHLETFKSATYYHQIKSLVFKPISTLNQITVKEVQDLIDISYPFSKEKKEFEYPYKVFNLLQKNTFKGYYYDYSEEIINNNATLSRKVFESLLEDRTDSDYIKKMYALEQNAKRTCENAYDVEGSKHLNSDGTLDSNKPGKSLLLEDLLIGENNKQLVYMTIPDIYDYYNNNKVIANPFINTRYKLGLTVHNLKTNKAITQCIFQNSTLLFPLRIVLNSNLIYTQFIPVFDDLNEKYKYIGFFIVRLNDDIEVKISLPECEKDYNYNDLHLDKSSERYWVIFVFKKKEPQVNAHFSYEFVNYRCNRVDRGTIMEQKKILYSEIQQLICMYSNDQLQFYIILKIDRAVQSTYTSNCKTFLDHYIDRNTNKKDLIKCIESNLHFTFLNMLNLNKILYYSVSGEQHILTSKKLTLDDLFIEFTRMGYSDQIEIKMERLKISRSKFIDNGYIKIIDPTSRESYALFPCHFDWSSNEKLIYTLEDLLEIERNRLYELINSSNKADINLLLQKLYFKEKLCIMYGFMNTDKKKIFKNTTCIKKECIQYLNTNHKDTYVLDQFSTTKLKQEQEQEYKNPLIIDNDIIFN